jgi:hypothetical protein
VHSGARMRPVARWVGRQQQVVWAVAGGRRAAATQHKEEPPAAASEPQLLPWRKAAFKHKPNTATSILEATKLQILTCCVVVTAVMLALAVGCTIHFSLQESIFLWGSVIQGFGLALWIYSTMRRD